MPQPSPFRPPPRALPFGSLPPDLPPHLIAGQTADRPHAIALRPAALPGPGPLRGLTVLAVEDSRFASDALRLMCQRSGARLRRAEDMTSAAAHLRCYRPDVVIVDIGLPDGNGADLIARLASPAAPLVPGPLVLGMSGEPDARRDALAAGAKGFLTKPVPGLLAFQAAILAHLPDQAAGDAQDGTAIAADPMALADDLRQAERALNADPPAAERAWIAGFLAGVARQSQDSALAAAARALRDCGMAAPEVADFLRARIRRQALLG